jgi:hypothetical protein
MSVKGLQDAYMANLELILGELPRDSELPSKGNVSPRKRCEAALMTLRQLTDATQCAKGGLYGS